MNFMDKIVQALHEVQLFEMAMQRKQILDKLRYYDTQIAVHIIKIGMWPNNPASKHWATEINAWLSLIDDMEWNRKNKLKESDYFNILWKGPFEDTDYVESIYEKYQRDFGASTVDTEQLKIKIENFYQIVCKEMSQLGKLDVRAALKTSGII